MMETAAFGLGYDEDHDVIKLALEEWAKANEQRAYFQSLLDEILAEEARWEARKKAYPEATTVWLYLKDLGYNDYVCAGILGNMMAECGGNTLNLKTTVISGDGNYYGICQWSRGYTDVWGRDLEGQLKFLKGNIQYQFKTFGNLYKSGFTYKKFLALTSCHDAALAFAKVYERCGSGSYGVRQDNAMKAYNYYVSKK